MKVQFNLMQLRWNVFLSLLLAVIFVACSDDDDSNTEPAGTTDDDVTMTDDDASMTDDDMVEEPENKSSGFVIVGSTSSGSELVKYSEELPTGNIDLSDGKDFAAFFPVALYDNALYMARVDNSAGFSKVVVDADGEVVEEAVIPTIDDGSFQIAVKDSETGVFQDRATPDIISIFNPTTLEVTGNIDLSAGLVPGDIDQRYQRFMFRGDDVFAPIRGNDLGESFPTLVVHQGNVGTGTFVGDTERIGNGFSDILYFNDFGQNVLDSQGNLYIVDAGNVEGQGVPARVNKIPAGSNEIDPDYTFEPAAILNPANVFLPTVFTFYVVPGTDTAIAVVNSETPQEAIDIVLDAGGLENLTNEQLNQIFNILFTAASARWCELDLVNQTVTPIDGIPPVGVFAAGSVFTHEGDYFIPVATPDETAYYRWNATTGAVSQAFTISGADLVGVFNIANNN
ncbi:MAG: hypothetical protein AAGB24_08075 [Bacteroidota bacterium]